MKKIPRNIWLLTLASYLTDVSSEMLTNLMPLFLVNVLGQRTSVVGLIEGVAETTASLVKIISGQLSDRLGQRKWLTVLGYGLSTLAKPFLYFANTWGWVLGVRFADRVGKGIRTAPRDALLADSITPEQRGLAFGLHRAGDTAGAFTGLLIAALVIWLSQAGGGELTRATFQVIVLLSIIPAMLAVIVLALGVREIKPQGSAKTAASPTPQGWKSFDGRFKWFLLAMIVFTLGNSSDAFILLRGQERGLTVLQILGMSLTFNAVYTLCAGPAGALSDRLGRRKLIWIGWLFYGLIYLGFAAAPNGLTIWLLYGCYGFYYALTEGAAKALVADLVPQEQRGTAYGYYNAAIGLTALPASLIAGLLWQGAWGWLGFGPAAPFVFGATMALFAGILFRRL
jgi:MFS family permease